jgi:hypothetical protein
MKKGTTAVTGTTPKTQPGQRPADTARGLFDQKRTNQIQDKLSEGILQHSSRMMALSGQ